MKAFTLKVLYVLIPSLFFAYLGVAGASEELVITTYYPSPYGSYRDLRADYLGVGSAYRGTSLSDGNMVISGRVGVNTTSLPERLNVNGNVYVNGNVDVTGDMTKGGVAYDFPDYVFSPSYNLMPFSELRKFLSEKKHLPGMPSAEAIRQEGIKLFEQNRRLLEKIEEAHLYILQLEERLAKLEAQQGK